MNKLDPNPSALTFPIASHLDPRPVRRLIVLLPESELDTSSSARKIWELANAMGAHVLFLSLCSDRAHESRIKRQLVTLSAMVRDDKVFTEETIVFGKDWVGIVKLHWQAGDMVVCFEEQQVGPLNRPLSRILQSNLNVPLYILSGIDLQKDSRPNWLVQATAWIGSIAIILGFFLLQVQTDHLAKNWAHTTLLVLSILVEGWMILVWNDLFN